MAQYNITPDTRRSARRTPPTSGSRPFCAASTAGCAPGSASPRSWRSSVAQSPSLVGARSRGNPLLFWGLMIAQLGIVFFLSARVDKIAGGTASLLFVLYSALTGVTFAFILLAFTGESVATTFMICAGMFGASRSTARPRAAAWPAGASSSSWASSASCWRRLSGSSGRTTASSSCSASSASSSSPGLTAYDAQRLKQMALALPSGQIGSYAIVGALTLYLDFINLFLMLLRFTGSRRDSQGKFDV